MSTQSDLETQLRELLTERAEQLRPGIDTPAELRRLKERFPGERRRGALTLVAAAAAVVVIAGSLAAGVIELTTRAGGSDAAARPAPVLPAPAPTVTRVPLPAGAELTAKTSGFDGPSPDLVVNGVLWIDDVQNWTVVRFDAATMRRLGSTTYPGEDGAVPGVLTRSGNVVLLPIAAPAVFGPTQIARFDATTGQRLNSILVSGAGAITTTPQGVFAVVGAGKVGLLDPVKGRVLRTFAMPVDHSLAYADGLLWGWDLRHSLLVGVDPARGVRVRAFDLPGYADLPLTALDAQTLLIGGPDGTVELDVVTGAAPAYTPAAAVNFSADAAGRLWGVVDGRTLVELDPLTLRMVHSYSVAHLDLVLVAGDRLFAADGRSGEVRAFDLTKLRAGR
jgi:hypothetical protein